MKGELDASGDQFGHMDALGRGDFHFQSTIQATKKAGRLRPA